MTNIKRSGETAPSGTPLTTLRPPTTLREKIREAYDRIFGHQPLPPLSLKGWDLDDNQKHQGKDMQGPAQTRSLSEEPEALAPLSGGEAKVTKLTPKLIIDNTERSAPKERGSILQLSLGNAGYETLYAIQEAPSVTDLIHCVRRDYLEKIREIELKMSIRERAQLKLIGERGIQVTVVILESLMPAYTFIRKELAANCNLVLGKGGQIEKSYEDHIGYGLPYDTIQIIFDLDAKGPIDIYNTPSGHEDAYYKLLGKSLTPMMKAFLQRLKEINTETRDMYLDPLTGLFNRASYEEATEALNFQGRAYAEYFIEINSESVHVKKLGYYGRVALLQAVADKVKGMGADRGFLFDNEGEKYIIFIDVDAINSPKKREEFLAISASFADDVLFSEKRSPHWKKDSVLRKG